MPGATDNAASPGFATLSMHYQRGYENYEDKEPATPIDDSYDNTSLSSSFQWDYALSDASLFMTGGEISVARLKSNELIDGI